VISVNVSFQAGTVGGRHGPIAVRTYTSDRTADARRTPLVWLHGGGFAYGGLDQPESHSPAMSVAAAGRTVVTVDYHLVTRWNSLADVKDSSLTGVRFPIPLEDVLDVVQDVAADTADRRVLLGGASAGACLAAAAARDLAQGGSGSVVGLVLAYGTFHAELPAISAGLRARIRGRHSLTQFRPSTVRRMNHNYAGSSAAMRDARAFPGGHDLKNLPDTLMIDADRDSLRASGEAFAAELRSAGVPLQYDVVPETRHGFLNRPGTPGFVAGTRVLVRWLAERDDARGRKDRGPSS
jgi:xylan 1,4-beta-xylosidase